MPAVWTLDSLLPVLNYSSCPYISISDSKNSRVNTVNEDVKGVGSRVGSRCINGISWHRQM
jgi:hypothetical protein